MSDPAAVMQAIKAFVYITFPTEDGGMHEIGFRTEVETPAGKPVKVVLSINPGDAAIRLDETSPAYANALAFADSLRRLALSVTFLPVKRQRKSA